MNPFDKGVGTRSADPETPVEAVKAKDILPLDKQKRQLPPIKRVGELVKLRPAQRPEIIKGILRTRCKMSLGGAAKARKTWQLLDLATAVATGNGLVKVRDR